MSDTPSHSSSETAAPSRATSSKSHANRKRRTEIIAGIVISPSEAVKWISRLLDKQLADDGSDDFTALLHLKMLGKRKRLDVLMIAQSERITPDGAFIRQPFMVVTQRKMGKFYNRDETGNEEVKEESLKMTRSKLDDAVQAYLKDKGVTDLGFYTYFYQ
ncbi:hypothetical protein Moror_5238 [Moniliophthora roreri MCA 2997]|uniref:Uncharacterized protein n=1 Tax=Moniliophthora roreri (strain MCA 2997) TaxID=1381753 RepID=V2WQS0_MONRO|nr:hypothetical protein Moror_5238 [Moniliophthora roreri MCA 2997]